MNLVDKNASENGANRKRDVWLCDIENAIAYGKNVSGLQWSVKKQLGKSNGLYVREFYAAFTARRGDAAFQRPWQSLQSHLEDQRKVASSVLIDSSSLLILRKCVA
ncbi:hypothetical protein T10_223 [Trichinella papuae]|uniref:Uncharacterized protein n=1 Tax=Trichinella papuae TaxID=268474 RepID=A0A0V1N513_9BILA|nr:hypothetical protein T10_223 [Trichinella papuae]